MEHRAREIARALARAAETGSQPSDYVELMAQVDALFAAHQDLVYATCLKFVRKPELAIELAQDTLLRAYQKLPGFRGEARFSTWLVSIARYECLNALRKRHDLLTEDGVLEPHDPASSALARLRHREREALLRDAAAAVLDATEQSAVQLRYIEHQALEHIDEVLGLDGAGARAVLQRSKRKLQKEIRRRLTEMGHGSSFVRGSIDE